jgi:hypothetical protein
MWQAATREAVIGRRISYLPWNNVMFITESGIYT